MKRWQKGLLVSVAFLAVLVYSNTPARLNYSPAPASNMDLEALLAEPTELLIPGTEKLITWHGNEGDETEWSVVALHGFSATRQETAPLAALIAERLGANLFEARFAGHGLRENALVGVTAEQWLDDVANALTIGQLLGEKTVIIAVSNGAAIAAAMLDDPGMQSVDTVILLSPNFGPADPKALWITYPGGPLLLRLVSGTTHSWTAANEAQATFWTTSYPMAAIVELMRVVDRANEKVRTVAAPRLQLMYSPDDNVISVPALQEAFAVLESPDKEIVTVTASSDIGTHVIAGDIISPHNTLPLAEKAVEFILRPTR